jgi:ApbE superfamily uncharacterized protein (UPF0280 family)
VTLATERTNDSHFVTGHSGDCGASISIGRAGASSPVATDVSGTRRFER